MVTKICESNYVGDVYHTQNFIQIGLGISVLRMRDFAPLGTKWLRYFLGVHEKDYSRDARTDFDAKKSQTTWFRARKCLLGVAKPKYNASTPIFPKNRYFWAQFLT